MKYKVFTKTKGDGVFSQSEFATDDKRAILKYVENAIDRAEDSICVCIQADVPKKTDIGHKHISDMYTPRSGFGTEDIDHTNYPDDIPVERKIHHGKFGNAPLQVAKMIIDYARSSGWHTDKYQSDEDRVVLFKGKYQMVVPIDNTEETAEYRDAIKKIAECEKVSLYDITRSIFGADVFL